VEKKIIKQIEYLGAEIDLTNKLVRKPGFYTKPNLCLNKSDETNHKSEFTSSDPKTGLETKSNLSLNDSEKDFDETNQKSGYTSSDLKKGLDTKPKYEFECIGKRFSSIVLTASKVIGKISVLVSVSVSENDFLR
jgi:hypothetical protein